MTQKEALDLLKLGKNIFLTGPAGSGKTYLLNQYIDYLRMHGVAVAVTASTGIAATHLGGQTIHSWCGMGVKDVLADDEIEKILQRKHIRQNIKKAKVLIIDEVSMLHAHQLDIIDRILRHGIDFTQRFGGLQVVLCGDFFQLPPVAKDIVDKRFAYESSAWEEGEFQVCYLEEQHRQIAGEMSSILNTIRLGQAGENVKVPLRTRYKKNPEGNTKATKLYTKNISVDSINNTELEKIPGESKIFFMTTHACSNIVDILKRSCLAPEELHLKEGAEVMFIKNSREGKYVNGTRGIIDGFETKTGYPIVKTYDGARIIVEPDEWQLEDGDSIKARLVQIPLRLAWAVTIHKSQGMTLDNAEIDLSDAFEPGMGYVALSRVRTLSGLKLMGLNDMALQVDSKILDHDKKFKEWSNRAREVILSFSTKDKREAQTKVLQTRFEGVVGDWKKEERKSTTIKTAECVPTVYSLEALAKQRNLTVATVLTHLEKLKEEGNLPNIDHLLPSQKNSEDIKKEFLKSKDNKLSPIHKKLKGKYSFEDLRLVRLTL